MLTLVLIVVFINTALNYYQCAKAVLAQCCMTGMQLIIIKFVPKLELSFMSGQLFVSMVCVANVCSTALVRRKGFGFAIVGGICWCQIKTSAPFCEDNRAL